MSARGSTSSNSAASAASAVFSSRSLYARVAAFQSGFPFAVKHLVDTSDCEEARIVRESGPVRPRGMLPRFAMIGGDTRTLRLLFDLKAQPQHARNVMLSFDGAMGCAVSLMRVDVLDCLADLLTRDPEWRWDSNLLPSVFYSTSISVDVLEWVYHHIPEEMRVLRVDYTAIIAARGDLEAMQWLISHGCPVTDEAADLAACYSRTQVLAFLYQSTVARCTPEGVEKAAMKADLEAIELVFSQEQTPATQERAINAAARLGRLDVVRFFVESGIGVHSSAAFDEAARAGHLGILQCLHVHLLVDECSWRTMDSAAMRGHLDVVGFLHANGIGHCTTNAMNGAAANGHLDVVRFLHEHRTEGCSTRAMDGAAEFGYLNVVKFLHEHRSEGCSTDALELAVRHNHLDVVAFLCEHRWQDCDVRVAMVSAASDGALDAVEILHRRHPSARGATYAAVTAAAQMQRTYVIRYLCESQRVGRHVLDSDPDHRHELDRLREQDRDQMRSGEQERTGGMLEQNTHGDDHGRESGQQAEARTFLLRAVEEKSDWVVQALASCATLGELSEARGVLGDVAAAELAEASEAQIEANQPSESPPTDERTREAIIAAILERRIDELTQ